MDFDVLLTVHLSTFILVINQLDAQNLFYNKFISWLYMFRAHGARNMQSHEINLLKDKFRASSWLITKINNGLLAQFQYLNIIPAEISTRS